MNWSKLWSSLPESVWSLHGDKLIVHFVDRIVAGHILDRLYPVTSMWTLHVMVNYDDIGKGRRFIALDQLPDGTVDVSLHNSREDRHFLVCDAADFEEGLQKLKEFADQLIDLP